MGWSRANVMYDMAKTSPPPGSPLESLFILVWWMRQDIEFYRMRALAQAMLDPDNGKSSVEAWKEFTEHFYPFMKRQRQTQDQKALDTLMKEVRKGFMTVKPMQPLVKSKIGRRTKHYVRDN